MDMYLKICFYFCYRELAYEFMGLVKQISIRPLSSPLMLGFDIHRLGS